MSAVTIKQLFAPTVLTGSAATIFTMPTSASPTTTTLRNGRMRFTNVTAGAITVTAYAVPKGGTAADGNAFLKAVSIPATSYLDSDIPVLNEEDFVQALASAVTSITVTQLDGVLFTS